MDDSGEFRAQRFLRIAAVAIGFLAYWRLVFWDPTWDLKPLDAWLFLPTDPLPQAIFLVTAAVVYRRRESLRRAMRFRGSPGLAVLPLLAGASLFVWGHYVDAMDLVLISFMLVSIGGGLLWFGVRFARALAVPWVVLAFAFPVPAVVTNPAFYALRLWTAAHTGAVLQFVGIPVLTEGNVISGSGVIAQVIDTCSGLRSIEILTLVAIFYVSWFPARRLRQLLLVAVAPVVAYLFNLIRMCAIALAPTSEFSAAHTAQGLMVYFGAIGFLILTDRVLGRLLPVGEKPDSAALRPATELGSQAASEPGSQSSSELEAGSPLATEPGSALDAPAQTANDSPSVYRSADRLGAAALAMLSVAMLAVSIWLPRWSAPEETGFDPIRLPTELGGWKKGERIPIDDVFLWTVRYLESEYSMYERDGDQISVFVGADDRRSRSRSLISRKNGVPRRGFEVMERDTVALEAIEVPVERVVAQSRLAFALSYYWYEGTDALGVEILRALFAADQSPFRRSRPARVIRVATAVDSVPAARVEDEAKLRAFASSLAAALRD